MEPNPGNLDLAKILAFVLCATLMISVGEYMTMPYVVSSWVILAVRMNQYNLQF